GGPAGGGAGGGGGAAAGGGAAPPPATSTGLGSSLIVAFAERAGAQVVTERLDRGTRVVLSGRREASS
ncbi:MAG: hypothetical protein ACK4TR_16155, partial [Phenylobacterium sp.]